MECIAHRGFAGVNPENTIAAVSAACAVADWIEVDVRRCATGELVVAHDATVDRVTGARGPIADYGVEELAALDVLDSGSGIPTLSAVLDVLPDSVGLDVELKERGLATDAARLLVDRDGPVLVSSFSRDAIAAVTSVSDLPTALVGDDEPERLLEVADELGCSVLCLHHESARPAIVDRAHAAGRSVYAWTIRDRDAATRCLEAGVDGLIADDPAFCRDQ